MAQIDNSKVKYLVAVELTKSDSLDDCIMFLSALKTLCYENNVDVRQPATGAILSTEDKDGKTEY